MLKRFRSWHSGLSAFGKKVLWVTVGLFLVSWIVAATHPSKPKYVTEQSTAQQSAATQTEADTTSQPQVETATVTETEQVPFNSTTVNDTTLDSGKTVVRTAGVNGVKTLTYQITTTNGAQTDKKLLKEEVTTQPVDQVTAIGTKVATAPAPKQNSNCDPNYDAVRGACVPIASDVDCAGGSGNGPAYVRGPVYVIGRDIYGLDRDGNGVGCE